MNIITLTEDDMQILRDRFSHLEFISKHYQSSDTLKTYFEKKSLSNYEISDFLGIAYGFINGNKTLFMYGNGYALANVFGNKRVYGYKN